MSINLNSFSFSLFFPFSSYLFILSCYGLYRFLRCPAYIWGLQHSEGHGYLQACYQIFLVWIELCICDISLRVSLEFPSLFFFQFFRHAIPLIKIVITACSVCSLNSTNEFSGRLCRRKVDQNQLILGFTCLYWVFMLVYAQFLQCYLNFQLVMRSPKSLINRSFNFSSGFIR